MFLEGLHGRLGKGLHCGCFEGEGVECLGGVVHALVSRGASMKRTFGWKFFNDINGKFLALPRGFKGFTVLLAPFHVDRLHNIRECMIRKLV